METMVIGSPIPGVAALALYAEAGQLSAIDFLQQPTITPQSDAPSLQESAALLRTYFDSPAAPHALIKPAAGTAFQQRVWAAMQQIPAGETRTYGQLAGQLGSCARAVANACRANPVPVLIPCHRVVAASGIGGYMGKTSGPELAIKRWLLQHEGYGQIPE